MKIILSGLLISLLIVCNSRAIAELMPDTKITSVSAEETQRLAGSDKRLFPKVEKKILDEAGIKLARCYFRSNAQSLYMFVKMLNLGKDTYQCHLPSLNNSNQLEIRILVVNQKNQVIINTPEFITLNQKSPKIINRVAIFSEVANHAKWLNNNTPVTWVSDVRELYGFKVGLYQRNQLPETLKTVKGYFGGFLFDEEKQTLIPVEGLVTGMKNIKSSRLLKSILNLFISESIASSILNLTGNRWAGEFYTTGVNNRLSITASIAQQTTTLDITTSKSNLGHRLLGTINSSGDILVYDQYDNEDWSSFYGPATNTQMTIADYTRPPGLNDPSPPLNVIALSRTQLQSPISIMPVLQLLLLE